MERELRTANFILYSPPHHAYSLPMQTIGERLEEARKRKGISIREASEATKIRGEYLHKFESNQFEIKLPDIYLRGFIRLYANFLKLPGDKIVNDYLALGLGEGGRPATKGINREIYGKMEITHSSGSGSGPGRGNSTDTAPSAAAAALTPGADSVASSQRQPFQPRMPLGGLSRALEAKSPWLLVVGSVVVIGLVVWVTVALVGGRSTSAPVKPPQAVAIEEEPVYLIAMRPVQITSVRCKLDQREMLAAPVSLSAGQRHALVNLPMLVSVSARDAVQIDFKSARYAASGANVTGPGTLDLDFSGMK
jgi:transcriptional regulator with XRE-family HTH domain